MVARERGRQTSLDQSFRLHQDALAQTVIGAAIEVHRHLGPGLLESTYVACLAYELGQTEIAFRTEVALPLRYKGMQLECAYRIDFIVEERMVLEIKSVERLLRVHHAQLMTYLRLTGIPVGFIFNFNSARLVDGIRRLKLGF